MFIKNRSDVDVYTRKIYAYIANTKGEKYIEFIQNLLNKKQVMSFDKEDKIFRIVIADLNDYFLEHMNFCDCVDENLSVKEINECTYLLDEAFIEYAIQKYKSKHREHKTDDANLMYILKSILMSVKDVNSNICYALRSKNKDADLNIKYIIYKYTDANIKITPSLARKLGIDINKSIEINEFYELYEKYKQNQIENFEKENEKYEEIKLTHKDLLVFYYLSSFSEDLIDITIEEIAKDCRISTATAYRAIKKLEKARKIKVHKRNNRNVYKIQDTKNIKIDNKYKKELDVKEQRKYEKKIDKNTEIHTSSLDFRKRTKCEKLEKETKYKLYLYRQKYKEELENTKLSRLSRDDLLFFLINAEKFVENETLTLNKILKIIKYADSNLKIKNPIGWLISRFMISKGRFYFLLSKPKQLHKHEQTVENPKSNDNANKVEQEKSKKTSTKDVYISADLAYFAKKYNISNDAILSYLSKFENGDVSYIVEHYIANKIWKNLPREEKQKLISYAKKRIRSFAVPPPTEEEFKKQIRSIIAAKIKDDYLSLSIEERLQLKSSGQYDTS